MCRRIKKRFDIQITAADFIFAKSFELDKNITKIHGLVFTSDRDDLLYYRGSQKVEINRQEVFPEEYESKLLMTGINVSPNDRYYNLGGMEPGNFKITVEYKDTSSPAAIYAPYRVSLYVDCEIDEK